MGLSQKNSLHELLNDSLQESLSAVEGDTPWAIDSILNL